MENVLKPSARIGEIVDTANRLALLYSEDTALASDAVLKALFSKITELSSKLHEVSNGEKAISSQEAADKLRGDAVRKLDKYLKSYANIPVDALRESGEKLYKVFSKYGVSITRKSYAEESAQIESLLKDLSASELQADINALDGISQAIEELRKEQTAFTDKRLSYEKSVASQNRGTKSVDIKKELIKYINSGLVSYLIASKLAIPSKYTDFSNTVFQIISNANKIIVQRQKKQA